MLSTVRAAPVARSSLRCSPRPLLLLRSLSSSPTESTAPAPVPAAPQPSPSTQTTPSPSCSYFVQRTASQQLPVYQSTKAGGNKLLTKVQKISGRVEDLKRDLQAALSLNKDQIAINPLNRHIVIKGWVKKDVAKFLQEKQF